MKLKKLIEGKTYKNPKSTYKRGPSEVLKRMGQAEYRQRVEDSKKGKGSYKRNKKVKVDD